MADSEDSNREIFSVLQAQLGSQQALNEIFERLQEPLFRYIRSLTRDQALAEDVLQEVFIRIYRKLKWLREPRALRPWAYQIATRETFRHLKRSRRWESEMKNEGTLDAVPDVTADAHYSQDLIDRLLELVESLPPASRAVVVLFYLHELSLPEVAAVLEIPVGTVKSRLSYGLNNLRKQLEKD